VTVTAPGPVPTVRNERWHYAPLDEISARMSRSVAPSDGAPASLSTSLSPSLIDALIGAAAGATGPRIVFVNGRYAAGLSDGEGLPAGVRVGVADTGLDNGSGAAAVTVDDRVRVEEPIHVVHVAVPDAVDAPSVLSRARTIVELGDDTHLAIVETFGGLDGATTPTVTEASTTIRLGDRAELVHYRIQIEAPTATHLGQTHVDQGAGSALRMTSVTLGGDIARNAVDVHLDAADAQTELIGINVTGGHQRHDTVVTVDHAASMCASNQRFTGVVDDHGRGSFSGEIIVRHGTSGSDAHQASRNLVLDRNAEADARPWLRILADDVRCTHGATVGRLDDDALHYLRSRGIPFAAARAMLIDAFVGDVTDSIEHEQVRHHVRALVAATASTASDQSNASNASPHPARSVEQP